MTFKEVNPRQNFPEMERRLVAHWKKHRIFEKSIEQRPKDKEFVFYDGPPFATGLPHYGHILAGTMKDVVPRYQTMRGHRVERVFGWDCHGLPIENLIEKELDLKTKKDIEEKFGIGKFNEACRASVLKYANEWESTVERMGRWVDFKNDYKTMDPNFMESIWWVFKELWNKKLIYKGRKSMHVCPRCVTPLSNFEVTLGYQDITDYSVTAKFKLDTTPKGRMEGEYFVLAWTTTPWTLPGNMYLALGEKIEYGVYKNEAGEFLILAKALEETVFGEDPREYIADISAKDLIGLTYEPLFPYFANLKGSGNEKFRILIGDFVADTDGTGVVHIAGGYGEDDMEFAKKHGEKDGSDVILHVNMDGTFIPQVTDFVGMEAKPKDDCTKTDRKIGEWLSKNGKLFKGFNYKHSYPHCWRCDTPLLNYATDAWFVSIDKIKANMVKENSKVNWVPDHVGQGRFNDWLENARDWCISRSRYWGTPLPVWIGEKSGEAMCIGSIEELEKLSGKKITDLHKHFVDDITFEAETDKETYRRIPEVLDCWFESGSMPYAEQHYPFENKKEFEENFPAEFIAEGLDQTRGWFYTLMVLGCGLFGRSPFKNVIVNGLVLAEDGKKMSKRLQNYPDPNEVFESYGADALRFYLMNSPVVRAEPLRFSEKGVEDVVRKILLPLWNSYSFFVTYANIDGWEPTKEMLEGKHTPKTDNKLDSWIISELEALLQELTEEMDNYNLQKASTPIVNFIESMTNWYIRRSRRRFWKSESDTDKEQAYATLYYCLVRISQIIAPFTPFIAEEIYVNLTGTESVHLSDWPEFDEKKIDLELNQEVSLTQQIVALGHAIRSQKKIKVRQPLSEVQVAVAGDFDTSKLEQETILEELNVKSFAILRDPTDIAEIVIKPDGKLLGPKYGGEVQNIIREAKAGNFEKLADGQIKVLDFILEENEYEIHYEGKAGLDVASEKGIVVGLNTEITEELLMEGAARDTVRFIQDMRKEVDYKVSDRIDVYIFTDGDLSTALDAYGDYIREETLTESMIISTVDEISNKAAFDLWKEQEIEGHMLLIGIKKKL
ncbi:MAG: isoleucine--tRNA ligase [Candidatus Peregrinibacteria bacterium]|nr:isoleucine--tRNA ligase [Candidatus Peregrinibacteria bacterium]MDZ4245099.1 isoleucine--tRNA ligase [Candidatus Gracilibacteria bacterium]